MSALTAEEVSGGVSAPNVQFRELEKRYQKVIPFLHVESKYFRPRAFLEAFHCETSKSGLRVANKKLARFLREHSDVARKVIYSNSSALLEVGLSSFFC